MRYLNYFFCKGKEKKIEYIDSQSVLKNSVIILEKEREIAIDTEFIWKDTYYPILSLIQISSPTHIFIFDILKLERSERLKNVFSNKDITKVFHSMRGDISILNHFYRENFVNVYDTQIAESLIQNNENNQIGYKNLVSYYFPKNLEKNETNSNWLRRPLTDNQIIYAADDVKYLLQIKRIQEKKLKKRNLENKLLKKLEEELIVAETNFMTLRLRRLSKRNNGISDLMKRIFLWREKIAEKNNIPPNSIFKDSNLKKLSSYTKNKDFKESSWIFKKVTFIDKFKEDFK